MNKYIYIYKQKIENLNKLVNIYILHNTIILNDYLKFLLKV
jgi:hypothetical protein